MQTVAVAILTGVSAGAVVGVTLGNVLYRLVKDR